MLSVHELLATNTTLNCKINEVKSEISSITTLEFNKLTAENFTARFAQANLASKNNIANFVKRANFDNKLKNVSTNKKELNELSKTLKQYEQKN